MKNMSKVTTTMVLLSSLFMAGTASAHTLMMRFSVGGQAVSPDGLRIKQSCEIYDDAIVMHRKVGDITASESRSFTFGDSLDAVKASINVALLGELQAVDPAPMGVTHDYYEVFGENGESQGVLVGLMDRVFAKNTAATADDLARFMKMNCVINR